MIIFKQVNDVYDDLQMVNYENIRNWITNNSNNSNNKFKTMASNCNKYMWQLKEPVRVRCQQFNRVTKDGIFKKFILKLCSRTCIREVFETLLGR